MENHISQQLQLLLISLAAGCALAAVYDLLRWVRLRRPAATHLLDGAFVLLCALTLCAFAMRLGGGEVRLYALAHMLLGAALYLLACAPLLRPLWAFWDAAAGQTARLLRRPLLFLGRLLKKTYKSAKKDFHFFLRYAKIRNYKWEYVRSSARKRGEGGRVAHEKAAKERARPRFRHRAGAGGAHRRHGHRAGADVRQAGRSPAGGSRHHRPDPAAPPGE